MNLISCNDNIAELEFLGNTTWWQDVTIGIYKNMVFNNIFVFKTNVQMFNCLLGLPGCQISEWVYVVRRVPQLTSVARCPGRLYSPHAVCPSLPLGRVLQGGLSFLVAHR